MPHGGWNGSRLQTSSRLRAGLAAGALLAGTSAPGIGLAEGSGAPAWSVSAVSEDSYRLRLGLRTPEDWHAELGADLQVPETGIERDRRSTGHEAASGVVAGTVSLPPTSGALGRGSMAVTVQQDPASGVGRLRLRSRRQWSMIHDVTVTYADQYAFRYTGPEPSDGRWQETRSLRVDRSSTGSALSVRSEKTGSARVPRAGLAAEQRLFDRFTVTASFDGVFSESPHHSIRGRHRFGDGTELLAAVDGVFSPSPAPRIRFERQLVPGLHLTASVRPGGRAGSLRARFRHRW